MTDQDENTLLGEILSDDLAKQVIADFGVANDTPEAQAQLISAIGENIMQRVVLEIVKMLPDDARQEFGTYVGKGDIEGMRQFLLPYIPDLDDFIQHHASREYESTKTQMMMVLRGEDDSE